MAPVRYGFTELFCIHPCHVMAVNPGYNESSGYRGPHFGLSSPYRHNNLPSVGTGGLPIGLEPKSGQKTTLTLLLFGILTRAKNGTELSFNLRREWL